MSDTSVPLPVPLGRAELIEISGADAIAFAHAQFGSDVQGLAPLSWQWSSWLTAQGRTRSVFALLRTASDRLLLWLPLGDASATRDALARFVLRAKVQISAREDWSLGSLEGGSMSADRLQRLDEYRDGYAFAQPGPERRVAWLGPAPSTPPDPSKLDAWRLADIAAGLPWLAPATQDEFVPQALDLERLDAIRFDKGCYPGQEIAARLHFRGGGKQRPYRLSLLGEGDAPAGMRIAGPNGNAGIVLYSAPSSAQRKEALVVLADTAPDSLPITSANHHAVENISNVFAK
jgi:folate-binding protein YgfZ